MVENTDSLFLVVINILFCFWIINGIISLLYLCGLVILEAEESFWEFLTEIITIDDILNIFIAGPIGIILTTRELIESKNEEREENRSKCGWWELKEYGGKY